MIKLNSIIKVLAIALNLSVLLFLFSCSTSKKVSTYEQSLQFSEAEIQLIEGDENQKLRVLKNDNEADLAVLTKTSKNVNLNEALLLKFTKRLHATVLDSASLGVGIAAPQVGLLRNIIWVQRFDKESEPFELYLNPKIIQYSKKKQSYKEGCLSVPDRMDFLETRSYAVVIECDKLDGTRHIELVEGFTAIIFQHEIDHLNGILYIDRLEEGKVR